MVNIQPFSPDFEEEIHQQATSDLKAVPLVVSAEPVSPPTHPLTPISPIDQNASSTNMGHRWLIESIIITVVIIIFMAFLILQLVPIFTGFGTAEQHFGLAIFYVIPLLISFMLLRRNDFARRVTIGLMLLNLIFNLLSSHFLGGALSIAVIIFFSISSIRRHF
jgi:hypothetical protein